LAPRSGICGEPATCSIGIGPRSFRVLAAGQAGGPARAGACGDSPPLGWQSPHKLSYYLEEDRSSRLAEIEGLIAAAGLKVKLVYSDRRFLDLLPNRRGKGEAAS
jgi:hypothetical protein